MRGHVGRKERLRGVNREKRYPPADRPREHSLYQKRRFHERLARPEIPHYLYLALPRVDSQAYGVGYQKHRGGREKNTEEYRAELQKSYKRRELLDPLEPLKPFGSYGKSLGADVGRRKLHLERRGQLFRTDPVQKALVPLEFFFKKLKRALARNIRGLFHARHRHKPLPERIRAVLQGFALYVNDRVGPVPPLLDKGVQVGEHYRKKCEHRQRHSDRYRGKRRIQDILPHVAQRILNHVPEFVPRGHSLASLPWSMTMTLLLDLEISALSWVATIMVAPRAFISRNIPMTSSASSGSRFPVGSSATSISGSLTRARASDTLCCSPPERLRGRKFAL